MEITKGSNGDILFSSHHDLYCDRNNPHPATKRVEVLSEHEQRDIISWLWKNNPVIIRDIICEDCPEVC